MGDGGAATSSARRGVVAWFTVPRRPVPLLVVLAMVGYIGVCLCGVTTSSIAVPQLRTSLDSPSGLVLGEPRIVRSDEYLRQTPWRIGLTAQGGDALGSPLAYPDPFAGQGAGPMTAMLYPDVLALRTVGHAAPRQVVAAVWWFPTLMVVLLLPAWFRRLGVAMHIALPLTLLVVLAPVTVWWSWEVLDALTPALIGTVSLSCGVDLLRRPERNRPTRWLAYGLLALSALAFARCVLAFEPWSYLPWNLVLTPAVALPLVLALVAERRRDLGMVLATLTAALVVAAIALAAGRGALEVLSGTVYPGQRRSAGTWTGVVSWFGAPHLGVLLDDPAIAGSNQSELSSSFLVLGTAVLVLVWSVGWRNVGRPQTLSTAASTGLLTICGSWCAFDWPASSRVLVPLALVPPARLVAVLGLLATLTFGLVLSLATTRARQPSLVSALTCGTVALVVTAAAGIELGHEYVPSFSTEQALLGSVMTALAVSVAVMSGHRRWGLAPLALIALVVGLTVNPLQAGFGDLQAHEVSAALSLPLGEDGSWASDDLGVDAALLANGRRSLSGQQWLGPNREKWLLLDPTAAQESVWNRGTSYIRFEWTSNDQVEITNPASDMILVTANPCGPQMSRLGLALVASTRPLTMPCLTPSTSFSLGGADRYTYVVSR